MHSTEEESLLSDCLPHQHHSHRYYNKQNHGQLSLSETSFTSSYDSSSTSSSSTTTSSCSSSSSSSCSSASSSSLSSESSTDGSDTFLLRRPQHSQSCNNISEKQKCIEEDTTPLTGNRRHVGKQKQTKDDSSNNGFKQGTQKKTHDSFRKSKSMEALSHPSEKEGYATQEEQERRKIEVKKNLMKEKMKFSAFLNEITRQVLSPMRLTTLGVTDARKASDTEATSVRSRKSESSLDRSRRQRSRPVSADSVNSNQNSHIRHGLKLLSVAPTHHITNSDAVGIKENVLISVITIATATARVITNTPTTKVIIITADVTVLSFILIVEIATFPVITINILLSITMTTTVMETTTVFQLPKIAPTTVTWLFTSRMTTISIIKATTAMVTFLATEIVTLLHITVNNAATKPPLNAKFMIAHHLTTKTIKIKGTTTAIISKQNVQPHHAMEAKPKSATTVSPTQNITMQTTMTLPMEEVSTETISKLNLVILIFIAMENNIGLAISVNMVTTTVQTLGITREMNRMNHDNLTRRRISVLIQNNAMESITVQIVPIITKTNTVEILKTIKVKAINTSRETNTTTAITITVSTTMVSTKAQTVISSMKPIIAVLIKRTMDKRMNRESDGSLPPHQKKEVLNCKLDSSKKMSGPCGRAEEQTDFTGPSIPHESTHEMDKIMVLEKENEGLQQNLLKQTVKMECFGDFLNSHKLLEEELQRTRAELSDLTESFKILHENCSSTQQTNSLLEQKLNSVTKSMEGERERLSRRISALTEQLASAKFANNVDTLNVNSVLNKSNDHFLPDDAINQLMLPLAPPPVQFMDIQNYEKIKVAGQEQSLGSVPEEEESDWSEMGDEIPRFILTGSNRSQTWMPRDGDMDKDSESGGEDIVRLQSPRPLQIPHLQFTIHNEMFPAPPAIACPSSLPGESAFRITTSQNLGSTILIRSASLEEIPLACRQMSKELRGTEAMMDLHHPEDDTNSDLDNEIIHHWRTNNNRDGKLSEPESAPCSLQSVEQMLHQFMYEPQPSEGISQSRSELHGWTEGMAEEVLGGEQTQL
nr:serine-rich adhesin for platelets-like [Nerophis lumbriciformis]